VFETSDGSLGASGPEAERSDSGFSACMPRICASEGTFQLLDRIDMCLLGIVLGVLVHVHGIEGNVDAGT
jgi:hypothetical protein